MSESTFLTDAPAAANHPGAPLLLRQSREAAGLHIAALAAALKVPVKKLEALEAGRYEELPDMTFARALASSACRQLKIDPARVLEQIPGAVQPVLGDAPHSINTPFQVPGEGAGAGALAILSRPAVWGVLLLLLAALALALVPAGLLERAHEALPNLPETAGTAPTSPVTEVAPVEPAQDGISLSMTPAPELSTDDAPAQAAPIQAAPAVASEPVVDTAGPMPSSSLLSIRATGESWIEVINGSGSQVMQRVLKPGDVVDFSTSPPYSIVVGRADAVQVTVRGKPLDVLPYARNSVARFEVK
ncbi:helix-turn-helix domain-containing protein [Hydrogenophaga sp.]|uniref:helix-turn-helix domain-containing protein n=1 Tax=Hydrogenophaga sp. TaxID=1904254 RepID=UPI0025C6C656|nr:helix-turn-helix domain-containing protein [Hydrogenophaga sp.]